MLLSIDQGNTRTKFGIFHGTELQNSWITPTEKQATAATLIAHILPHAAPSLPQRWGLCTVVPELREEWHHAAAQCGASLTMLTGHFPTRLRNAYATPETLGADRLMAAVAASNLAGMPVIPVSLGTATVVDAVSADAAYLGGMIAPGISASLQALTDAASALSTITWQTPTTAIGRSSYEAMVNGLFYQQTGGLRAMIQAIREQLACTAPIVLTGGWATQLAPSLPGVFATDPHLVLRGIALTLVAGC